MGQPEYCRFWTTEKDFETICCDGRIIETKRGVANDTALDLANLACCRVAGLQYAAISTPLFDDHLTKCPIGTQVPLASLAGTNTRNMENYAVTYTGTSNGPADKLIETLTPQCLWASTASGVPLSTITVPAQIKVSLPTSSPGTGSASGGNPGSKSAAAFSVPKGSKAMLLMFAVLIALL
jgi:hypothetical protein